MLPRVIDARYAGDYKVWLRCADGLSGEIDLEPELWGAVFEPLKDKHEFARLFVHPDWGTIAWPNGADLAPEFLHDELEKSLASRSAAE